MQCVVHASSANGGEPLTLAPWPIHLSSAGEASIRCMLRLHPSPGSYLRAWVMDELDGSELCDTAEILLDYSDEEEWIFLNSSNRMATDGSVESARLFSRYCECKDGWTVCFDVKVGSDSGPLLRNVRVARSSGIGHQCSNAEETIDKTTESVASGSHVLEPVDELCLDCTEQESLTHLAQQLPTGFAGPTRAEFTSRAIEAMLQSGDDSLLPSWLLDPDLWRSIVSDDHMLTVNVRQAHHLEKSFRVGLNFTDKLQNDLNRVGYGRLPVLSWQDAGVQLQSLVDAIDLLEAKGFPPVFVFMYDQAWLLWLQLFDVMSVVMSSADVELDASVFAWSLKADKHGGKVGSNFGRPHRDDSFDECHTADGKPCTISVWVPLVPVTPNNGCMYVVPADRDPLFAVPTDPLHMSPASAMPWSHIRPLPAPAGEALLWRGNLIHWGSSCDEGEQQPRKSIASAFMLPGTSKELTISRSQLVAGLSMPLRLRIILRALLIYEPWHPRFEGLGNLSQAK